MLAVLPPSLALYSIWNRSFLGAHNLHYRLDASNATHTIQQSVQSDDRQHGGPPNPECPQHPWDQQSATRAHKIPADKSHSHQCYAPHHQFPSVKSSHSTPTAYPSSHPASSADTPAKNSSSDPTPKVPNLHHRHNFQLYK